MSGFTGCFSDRVFTCLFLFTLTGRILGRGNGPDFVKVFVKEDSDVILPCSLETKKNIESDLFDWRKIGQKSPKEVFIYDFGFHYNNGHTGQDEQFKGRVSHFPDQLKNGNASIKIWNTTMADSGNYTCAFPHLQPNGQIFHVELVVDVVFKDRSGEIPGAAPKPNIRTLNATEDWSLLQCDVQGAFPEPKVEWKDSAGDILPAEEPKVTYRGGRYDVTLLATVNKTDHFHCVVSQEETGHQTEAETFVFIPDKLFEDTKWSTGDVIGWFMGGILLGVLAVVAVEALLVGAKCITVGFNRCPCQQRNGPYEAPAYSLEQRNGSCEAPAGPHQQGNGFIKGLSDTAVVLPAETTDISPA